MADKPKSFTLPEGYKLDSMSDVRNIGVPEGYKLDPFVSPLPTDNEIGRTAVEGLPFLAGLLPAPAKIPAILAATALKTAAKKLRPDLVGEPPQGIGGGTLDMIKEVLTNAILPEAITKGVGLTTKVGMEGIGTSLAKAFKNMPAVREGSIRELSGNIRSQLGENYQPLGDYQPISVKPTSVDYQPIKITPGQEYQPLRKGQPYQPQTQPTVDVGGPMRKVPSGEFQIVPGEVQKAQDRLGTLITKDKIDAAKALDELTGKNASLYSDAMPTDTYQNVQKLLTTMKGLQGKSKMDMLLNYSNHKLLWSGGGLLTGGLTGAALGHPIAGLAIGGTPIVLNGILDKIMANPETAKLVTEALTTPANSQKAIIVNRALSELLPRLIQAGADYAATPER